MIGCRKDDIEKVLYSLSLGLDLNEPLPCGNTPLIFAARMNRTVIAELLLNYGADVNGRDEHSGGTALWEASGGELATIELLIRRGADVNLADNKGYAPLHEACWRLHAPTIRLLLENGADAGVVSDFGDTPLDMVFRRKQFDNKIDCEHIFALFQELAPVLYFSTFCTTNISPGGM